MLIKTVNPNIFDHRVSCANNALFALHRFRQKGNVRKIDVLKIEQSQKVDKLRETYREIEHFETWVESSHLNQWHAFEEGMRI